MIVGVGSSCVLKRNLGATSDVNSLSSTPDPIYAPALLYTDGEVKTLATEGGKLYLGGRFSHVGPYTRSAPTVNLDTGAILTPSIKFEARIIEPDGSGGYYVGGTSSIYETSSSANKLSLARILPDGAVDGSFSASFYGDSISGIKKIGNTLYVAGTFSGVYVGATLNIRQNLAALDPTTGALQAFQFNTNITGSPPALEAGPHGELFFAATVISNDWFGDGNFVALSGAASESKLLFIDPVTPAFVYTNTDGEIRSLKMVGTKLYAGGAFTTLNPSSSPVAYSRLMAFDMTNPMPSILAEDPLGADVAHAYQVVNGLASDGTNLYVTGGENATTPLTFVAKITAGAVVWVNDSLGTQNYMGYPPNAVAVSPAGDEVYAAINNVNFTGGEHVEVQAFDPATGTNSDLSFGDHTRLRLKSGANELCTVRTLATSTNKLHIGGHFSSIVQERHSLAQIDLDTSLPTTWDPDLMNGDTVYTMLASDGTVYFGGSFGSIHSSTTPITRWNLAAVSAADASALSWNPGTDGQVRKLHKIKNSIIALGPFGMLGGGGRSRIGIVNATTGALDTSWDPGYIYGGIVNFNLIVRSTVAGNDLYFAAVDNGSSYSGAGTSQAAVYRLSFSDDADPAITAYWPFQGNGQFSLTTLPDQSGILVTGMITAFDNQMVTSTFNSLMGIKTGSLETFAAGPALTSSFPLTNSQMQYAMDGMIRRGWVQKDRYYLGGFANTLFGGATDPWGLAVINIVTGALENPAANATLPTFQLTGSAPDGMGIIGDVLTIGNTTYVGGTFTSRQMLTGHAPASQTPYILTLKDGVWMEP